MYGGGPITVLVEAQSPRNSYAAVHCMTLIQWPIQAQDNSRLDKPARLSFSFSLDLLLNNINQTNINRDIRDGNRLGIAGNSPWSGPAQPSRCLQLFRLYYSLSSFTVTHTRRFTLNMLASMSIESGFVHPKKQFIFFFRGSTWRRGGVAWDHLVGDTEVVGCCNGNLQQPPSR